MFVATVLENMHSMLNALRFLTFTLCEINGKCGEAVSITVGGTD